MSAPANSAPNAAVAVEGATEPTTCPTQHSAAAEPASSGAPCSPVSAEPLQHVAYLHDGTLEGLLSCVFESYARHEDPEDIMPERLYQPRFEQSSLFVPANYEHARRVRQGIRREAGRAAFSAIAYASTVDDPLVGIVVYRFIRYIMSPNSGRNKRRSVLNDLSNPLVADLVALQKRTANEAQKMRQFVRFSRLENGIWFARCNPNANVVPLVMRHFVERFNVQPFIIYDENHRIAGVYDGGSWQLVAGEAANIPPRSADDAYIEALWRQFYDSLSIQARYNPELRRHFMPVRLWQNLPEVNTLPQGRSVHEEASLFTRRS